MTLPLVLPQSSRAKNTLLLSIIFSTLLTLLMSGCVVEESLDEDPEGGRQLGGEEVISLDMSPSNLPDGFIPSDLWVGEECSDSIECPDGFELDFEACECIPLRECPDIGRCPPGSDLDPETCECSPSACDCPAVEDPVCGENGETYSSPCQAECIGIEIEYRGECMSTELCFEDDVEPSCESLCSTFEVCINDYCGSMDVISPECVAACREEPRDFLQQFWPNLCEESDSCEGFIEQGMRLFGEDVCETITRECEEPNPEVMYVSDDPEECEFIDFACPGNSEYYYDECGCGCYVRDCDQECGGVEESPVCTPDGRTFPSECHAFCLGAYEHRPCATECTCPEIYEPECGLDGFTYSNSCIRECQGVPLLSEGECREGEYLCEDLDVSEELSCDQVCGAVNSCFVDQCSADELAELDQSCQVACSQIEPYFFCEFGRCQDIGFLINDFNGANISCLDQRCPDEDRGAEYFAYDTLTCSLIGEINCESGESFNDECGCGCLNSQCPSQDQARYVSYETDVCAQITIACPEGSEIFNDECGCGCRF